MFRLVQAIPFEICPDYFCHTDSKRISPEGHDVISFEENNNIFVWESPPGNYQQYVFM
jgi:hypothetical protein